MTETVPDPIAQAITALTDAAWIVDDQVLVIETLDPCTMTDQSKCPRWTSPGDVDALLEVPAGALEGVQVGETVTTREDTPS